MINKYAVGFGDQATYNYIRPYEYTRINTPNTKDWIITIKHNGVVNLNVVTGGGM